MNVGAVAALTVLLAVPAVLGLVTGATSPLGAALRLLAALLAAMVAEGVLRRLLAPAPDDVGDSPAVPRQRGPASSATPQVLPGDVAERLRSPGS
ncbi:hypothetical protein WDZ17_02045 [Pseudokineococcus basanitobsidens]|uniref:Uncharacterized protein n=1 Tax=Pseudokineococcus basanitobsidens TaxID=1926649 RepID=A0ABU8RGA3_9ACTN